MPPNRPSFLKRLGLDRPELRAWAMYDLANSAFATTVISAVFPIYFSSVAAADLPGAVATTRFATATAIAMGLVALLAPFLGPVADFAAMKKKLLGAFLVLGIGATGGMFFIQRGDWLFGAGLFIFANVGFAGTLVFYDALLPHIVRPGEIDRVSSAGYALGYLGGGILLAANLAWIQFPAFFGMVDAAAASRWSFLSVAVWWLLFAIPLFRRVPEPPPALAPDQRRDFSPVRGALGRLRVTLRDLRAYPQAFLFLVAFLIYNDGIGTIARMAAAYGIELGIGQGVLIGAILMVQFIGVPFAFLFGGLASRIGAKRGIFLALTVYACVSVLGYFMKTATHFIILAASGRHGAGRLPGPFPLSVRQHDSTAALGGVFCLFRRVRKVCGHSWSRHLCRHHRPHRFQPQRHTGHYCVLLCRRGPFGFRERPRGQRLARQAEQNAPE